LISNYRYANIQIAILGGEKMATFSMCFTVCAILAKVHPEVHPEGLTIQELHKQAHEYDPSRFDDCESNDGGMVQVVLGIRDGIRQEYGWVQCWKEEDGKICYDTSRKTYAPTFERYGFGTLFNDWLKKNELAHLVLYEKLSPDNSERCPLGFDWESIPGPGHCDWDYESEECGADCRLSAAKINAASCLIEKRQWNDHYKRPLDGD
jgi:hypothetical protein